MPSGPGKNRVYSKLPEQMQDKKEKKEDFAHTAKSFATVGTLS